MTRKDYELIASAINGALKNNANIIDVLADVFRATNPRFLRDTFVEACLKDWSPPPPKEAELSDIVVGGVYELKFALPEDDSWMQGAKHVVVLDFDPCNPVYPVRVGSIDGDEDMTDWIQLDQLGSIVSTK